MLDGILGPGRARLPGGPGGGGGGGAGTRTLGGAGNVVNNLVALGAQVEVLGLVGDDNPGRLLTQEMVRLGVAVDGLFTGPGRRTSRKTRVIGASQQVVRIDRETRTPAPPAFEAAAREFLQAPPAPGSTPWCCPITPRAFHPQGLLQELIESGALPGVSRGGGPKGADYSLYAGATVITPNRKEAELAVGYSLTRREDLLRARRRLTREPGPGLPAHHPGAGRHAPVRRPPAAPRPPHPGPGGV